MYADDMDAVFHALAHRDRRRILDLVQSAPGCCIEDVNRHFTTSRIAILKHLRVLEKAQLIHSEKVRRQRKLYFNVVPIQLIHDRWATAYSALWAGAMTALKHRVEAETQRQKNLPRKRHA
jgi:DNA-binding transcriptional ArsR family regulator